MKSVYVTKKILPDGLELLQREGFDVQVWPLERSMTRAELEGAAKGANALITMLSDKIDRDFLEKNSHLKIVANYAVGTNNIDKETAQRLGIAVGNTPDVLTESTAELALGLLIATARHFKAAIKNVEEGLWKNWEPCGFLGHGLKGKNLGIIGYGRIGKRFAEMARMAFEMDILVFKKGDDLPSFLRELDVLSLHVPLTTETRHMIGERELQVMKKTAILINTSRGEVLDQDALVAALRNRQIFAAGLDVTDPEPLPKDHILVGLDNALVLPHIASATFHARSQMSLLCAANIIREFS